MSEELVQLHPRLPKSLVAKIDKWREGRNVSRAAAINVILAEALADVAID